MNPFPISVFSIENANGFSYPLRRTGGSKPTLIAVQDNRNTTTTAQSSGMISNPGQIYSAAGTRR